MVDQRLAEVAKSSQQVGRQRTSGLFGELRGAASELDRHGFIGRPEWHTLRSGARPDLHRRGAWRVHTVGNTVLLPFLNTTSGGAQCWTSHLPREGSSVVLLGSRFHMCCAGVLSKPEFRVEDGLFNSGQGVS